METKIKLPEFATKLFAFETQFEKSKNLLNEIKAEQAVFDAFSQNKNIYEELLKKTLILNAEGKVFEVQNLKEPSTFQTSIFVPLQFCPRLFVETNSYRADPNNFGLMPKIDKNLGKEYCLLFDGEGNLFLVIPSATTRSEIYSFFSASRLLILDLPLIIAGLVSEKNTEKAKATLETIITKNPTSTFTNVCNYVKNNKKEVEALSPKFEAFAKTISCATQRKEKAEAKISISKTFVVNGYTLSLPYTVDKLEATPVLKLDLASATTYSTSYREIGSDFPVLLVPKGKEIIPYFMAEKEFKTMLMREVKDIFALPSEKIKGFLSLEAKTKELNEKIEAMAERRYENLCGEKELSFPYFPTGGTPEPIFSQQQFAMLEKNIEEDAKIAKKNAKQELLKNVALVLTAFDKHMADTSNDKILALQEKLLVSFKRTNKQCKKKMLEITSTLGKIYQKEILLANL